MLEKGKQKCDAHRIDVCMGAINMAILKVMNYLLWELEHMNLA